jgi:hypothetical protein
MSLREVLYVPVILNSNKHILLFSILIKYSFFLYLRYSRKGFIDKIRIIEKVQN